MNIFLIGFMGTGKSTISAALGRRLSREVVEMDELIAKREGMPISEIFEKKGEPYFRELETGLLVELQQKMTSSSPAAEVRPCGNATWRK